MTVNGHLRRVNAASSGVLDAARCHGCGHPVRIHNVVGCVSGQCECLITRAELMPDAPRLEVPDGIESTPAVKAAPQADRVRRVAAQGRPVEADAPAAVLTAEEEREAAALLAAVERIPVAVVEAPRRRTPRPVGSALVGPAVVCEADAVEVVAAVVGDPAAAVPPEVEPLDVAPFLSRSLSAYNAWYCAPCFQRRHDPGACPQCSRPLVPVHVIVYPRSLV